MPARTPRKRAAANQYRAWVMDQLRPLLPSGWDLRPYRKPQDAVERPTVFVQLSSIARLPGAPMNRHLTSYTLTIVDPSSEPTDADAAIDDEVADLLHALDNLRNEFGTPVLRWLEATRVVAFEQYQAMDVTVELITTAKPTTETKE